MNAGDGDDLRRRLSELFDDLREERQLAMKRRRQDELTEGLRQLELAVLKLESEEKSKLLTLENRLQSQRQIGAMVSDYEKEKRSLNRQLGRLKKSRLKLKAITEEGIEARATIKALEEELGWLREAQPKMVPVDSVGGRIAQLEQRIETLRESLEALRSSYREMEKEVNALSAVERELWKIDRSLAAGRKARLECDDLTGEIDKLKSHYSRQYHARRELAAMADLQKQIQLNNYEPDRHERLLHRIYNFLESELMELLPLRQAKREG